MQHRINTGWNISVVHVKANVQIKNVIMQTSRCEVLHIYGWHGCVISGDCCVFFQVKCVQFQVMGVE